MASGRGPGCGGASNGAIGPPNPAGGAFVWLIQSHFRSFPHKKFPQKSYYEKKRPSTGAVAVTPQWPAGLPEEKSPPFCGTAGTTGTRFNSAQQAICFRASARNLFWASLSAKTGVLRKQNPGFCAARARRSGAFRSDLRVLDAKTGGFNGARSNYFFAVPQGTPCVDFGSADSSPVLAGACQFGTVRQGEIPTFLAYLR